MQVEEKIRLATFEQLENKADKNHNHNELYYTKEEIKSKLNDKISSSLKGVSNGVAELDENGKVPYSQLPASNDSLGLSVRNGILCQTYIKEV